MSEQQVAWEKLAEQEAQALAVLLEHPARRVLVIVIAADDNGDVHMTHGVSEQTTGGHLRNFIQALEHKLGWLRDKLHRRA